jgi:UDP:flavonoid glycosyltransferase YjiC (YdhE family)
VPTSTTPTSTEDTAPCSSTAKGNTTATIHCHDRGRGSLGRHATYIVDGMSYSAQVEARASDIPYAALWHTLVDAAEVREGAGYRDENLVSHNAHRAERGLGAVDRVHDTLLDADWFLAMAYDVLDSPRAREWPNLHYVGAPMPRSTRMEVELPAGDAPLVLIGFSTTQMGQAEVLQRVVNALAGLDVRVLVTLGPVRADKLDLPNNAVAVESVPHDQVLPEVALVVSHVGHGTMCAAARHGVPILALPMGRDQDRNAVILTENGIGAWLPPSSAPSEITELAQRLLADDATQSKCAEVAAAISVHAETDYATRLLASQPTR